MRLVHVFNFSGVGVSDFLASPGRSGNLPGQNLNLTAQPIGVPTMSLNRLRCNKFIIRKLLLVSIQNHRSL